VKVSTLAATSLISIVDDDLSVREATTSLLEANGYVTAAFGSAEEFLRSERLKDTCCLVTDLCMPGVNGVDLQRRLSSAGHSIPTIVITAHSDGHMHAAALRCGALALLLKPVSEQQLISCLEGALQAGRSGAAQ
jgi:FixJ family two-component response regulator